MFLVYFDSNGVYTETVPDFEILCFIGLLVFTIGEKNVELPKFVPFSCFFKFTRSTMI